MPAAVAGRDRAAGAAADRAVLPRRAERLRRYLGESDPAANRATLRRLIERLAQERDQPVPFETFRQRVEGARFGIVITAHPTFALAQDLRVLLTELAIDDARRGGPPAARLAAAGQREHRPDRPLDLAEEHRQSLDALVNLHAALHQVYDLVFEVAQELYPERWTELSPRLVTFASWVGYDLDGRSDIPWTATFAKRLKVQLLQLARYRQACQALRARAAAASGVGDLLELLEARLALAIKQAEDEMAIFADAAAGTAAWRAQLARAARAMHAGRSARLVDAGQLLDLIARALRASDDPALTRALCILRAEIGTHGLGLAHTHTRLNARQLHNAIRKTIGMDHAPDDPSHRLSYLNAISALIDQVEPVRINFGSLLFEKATAKRTFMIIAQLLKYVDATQPIRFLIAECETGFTLLTALYFARLFGVEDKVEISPLFETMTALEQGGRVIGEALGAASFRAYVQRHGRLCVQTGFSDAGRALGQTAAAYAIERLRFALGRELAQKGLDDIELVIFDTHGESIGRGCHPESFADRLDYVDTPASRLALARLGIACKQEVSFQGGDGYTLFQHAARGVHGADPDPRARADPAGRIRGPLSTTRPTTSTSSSPRCSASISGSWRIPAMARCSARSAPTFCTRRARVRSSASTTTGRASSISSIRPSCARSRTTRSSSSSASSPTRSAGSARRSQRTRSASSVCTPTSDRFRRLMTMVEHAFKYSDLTVLRAYVDVFDPGVWLLRAARRGEGTRAEELQALSAVMERAALHDRLTRIWRIFTRDYMALANAFREHRRRTRQAGALPIAVDPTSRDVMHLLHGLRLVLIQQLYLRAVHVPEFSGRHEITRESLIARLIQLDVEPALARLGEIFPVVDLAGDDQDFGEPATYRSAENQSYGQEHAQIFAPIARSTC